MKHNERNDSTTTTEKNPNWSEETQLAIYKCSREVEPGSQLAARAGLEPGISGTQGRRPNH